MFWTLQATVAAPVKGKMFKGLCVCYSVILSSYFSVGISGYWAFGNQTQATVLGNFMGERKPLLPTWFIFMTNVFIILQVLAVTVVRTMLSRNTTFTLSSHKLSLTSLFASFDIN